MDKKWIKIAIGVACLILAGVLLLFADTKGGPAPSEGYSPPAEERDFKGLKY